VWLATTVLATALGAPAPDLAPSLTTAAAVRSLSVAEAREARTVRLEGSMVHVTVPRDALVLVDATEAVYVFIREGVPPDFQPGDWLEIEGVSDPGDFAPIVIARSVSRRDRRDLPAARRTTIAEVSAGGFDATWIEMEGIVRSCAATSDIPGGVISSFVGPVRHGASVSARHEGWYLRFAQGADQLMVRVNGPVVPEDLIDARVRLRGVVFNVHNASRQFVRANVQVVSRSMIEVVVPPPPDPYALPLLHASEILRFDPKGFSGHRVHVRGVVTGQQAGRTVWLRDEDHGVRVETSQPDALSPGDEIEVVGFADYGGYSPSLGDSIFRRIASSAAPTPIPLTQRGDISRMESDLVTIDAELLEVRHASDAVLLTLDWDGLNVGARLTKQPGQTAAPAWEVGSRVRIAGICELGQNSFSPQAGLWVANDFQLLLRSPDDVAVLRPAPWFNPRRTLLTVIVLAVAMLVALVAVAFFARREIRRREDARKLAEAQFSAMLAERNRMARDIHDTIAQELNAVSMQMELAKNSTRDGEVGKVMPFLTNAHQMVRHCLTEVRESIWNMRSHILEQTDLVGALREIATQLGTGLPCRIEITLQGQPRRLAPVVENNLLRIGQEALSNALKHAKAQNITLEIGFDARLVRLVVEDDGVGMPEDEAPRSNSHFGLRGMRERVKELQGKLDIGRGSQGGTRVEVTIHTTG
jgi:signal transduction histidine kinase